MLHRCTTSIRLQPHTGIPTYAPIVAAELVYQLESWYEHLPTPLRFDRESNEDGTTEMALSLFLRTQYYSCQMSIYWPAAYQTMRDGMIGTVGAGAGGENEKAVESFFGCYVKYMMSINACVRRCAPNAWTLYAS
jgi:hypothetical protein